MKHSHVGMTHPFLRRDRVDCNPKAQIQSSYPKSKVQFRYAKAQTYTDTKAQAHTNPKAKTHTNPRAQAHTCTNPKAQTHTNPKADHAFLLYFLTLSKVVHHVKIFLVDSDVAIGAWAFMLVLLPGP